MNKENENNKTGQFKQQAASFGVALAKVFSGVATSKDWITVLKFAIPVLLGGVLFSFSIFALLISLILGPIEYAQQLVDNVVGATASFFDNLGNWLSGNGWRSDKEAFDNIIKENQGVLGCKNASMVTATVMYYYQTDTGTVDWGDSSNVEIEEEVENDDGTTTTTEINYGKVLPDLKRLTKRIKSGDEKYEKYVKDTFLDKEPYNNLLEGYNDVDKRKDEIYEEMKSIAEGIPCENAMSGMVCYGEYSDSETIDIALQDLNNVYVNLANCSCPQGSLETCDSWQYQNIPFKDYIMGVVWAESYSKNLEAVKAQTVAAKSYTLGRIKSMGRTWHEVDGKYIIYMKNCTDDQVYAPITTVGTITERNGSVRTVIAANAEDQTLLSQAYDDTFNDFIWDNDTAYFVGPYCNDFGECNFCEPGTCLSQVQAKNSTTQTYKEILGYHYSDFQLLDLSTKTLQVSSVTCPAVAGTGQIRMPLDEDKIVYVSSPYGWRTHPVYGTRKFHSGIDYAANAGTPIYAIAPGKVVVSDFISGYGNCVIIGHDIDADGTYDYHSLYAHASKLLINQGENVSGGMIVAKVGSTGTSTGNHLHFEMRGGDNGASIDPTQILEDIKSGTSVFNQMIRTEKKYYNQADYANVAYCPGMKSNGEDATIQNAGCLPTAFAMVVSALKDSTVTPATVANHICNNYTSYRKEGSGTSQDILTNKDFLSQYSLQSNHIKEDYENKIKTALQNNKMIIVNVKGGEFNTSGAGHYFVLSELNNDGTVSVFDPGSRERTKNYNISDFVNDISTGIWIFE